MENSKSSSKSHKNIDAISYCETCKIFMCNKCLNYHMDLFDAHQIVNLNENNKEMFIDICKEKNRGKKLEFYCKNHNILCCAVCI